MAFFMTFKLACLYHNFILKDINNCLPTLFSIKVLQLIFITELDLILVLLECGFCNKVVHIVFWERNWCIYVAIHAVRV